MRKHLTLYLVICILVLTSLGIFFLTRSGSIHLSNGLVAWYKFDGSLNDFSGYQQHATNASARNMFVADRNGSPSAALAMDGEKDLLTARIASSVKSTGVVSISLYYQVQSLAVQNLICRRKTYDCHTPADFGGLGWSVNACSQREPHFAVISPDDINCETPRGIDRYTDVVYGLQKIDTGRWYHLTCVFEAGIQRIYLNGQLRQSLSRPFTQLRECDSNIYVIGGFVDELPTLFHGVIDDLRIYNRALNEDEIITLASDMHRR